jgi:hypothetical protein
MRCGIGAASLLRLYMSEQQLDSLGRTIAGPTDNAGTRLIAGQPRQSDLPDGYRELVKAAEIGQAKAVTVNVKLKAYRRAKLRKKDLHDLSDLRVAVNDLGGEIDAITMLMTYIGSVGNTAWRRTPFINKVMYACK